MANITKDADGNVVAVESGNEVVEVFTVDGVSTEIVNTEAAIVDIDNYVARRLANLESRLVELHQAQTLLTS